MTIALFCYLTTTPYMQKTTLTEQETRQFGIELAQKLQGGDVLCLYGDLGAGKTALTKGLALGLGIEDDITSPTFTLMNMYPIENKECRIKNLVHIDTYRLKNEEELVDIGAEDYLGAPDTVCVIEWPEKIEGLLKNNKIKKITIKHSSDNTRSIEY